MNDFGHPSIADVPARVTGHGPVGVATLRLADLYRRAGSDAVRLPQRIQVHLLALITNGRSAFTVDFARYACRPGSLLWVKPAQVVTLPPPGLGATLVLFEPGFPKPADGLHGRPLPAGVTRGRADGLRWQPAGVLWQPAGEDEEAIVDGITQLETDCARAAAGEAIPIDLLRHQLTTLLLRILRLNPEDATGRSIATGHSIVESEVFARFRGEVEERFAATHQVDDYANAIGCSVRTLTRASLAATGRTAKQVIDERVALEAKRMLAHTDLPVVAIAGELGFTEPTNFGRFFARTVGVSPGRFRADHR
jgi:AraC-like DNA-binding protein